MIQIIFRILIKRSFANKILNMKHVFAIMVILVFGSASNTFGQVSTGNGNWTMPTTWDCFCVPLPGANVTVAHNVVLNTDWATSGGSITINNGASLIHDATGRDILLSGGAITNNGTFELQYLSITSGTLENNGSMQVASFSNWATFENNGSVGQVDSLYTNGTLTNAGSIEVGTFYNALNMTNSGNIFNVDSIYNAGTLENLIGGNIEADSASNAGTLNNAGSITHYAMTNTGSYTNTNVLAFHDFTNVGTFVNSDTIIGTGSMTNTGNFTNSQNAFVGLDVSFLNAHPTLNNAYFENNGHLDVGDSWYNFDSFAGSGTGWVDVQDSSVNFGAMAGTFDFCDNTPNTIQPPQSPTTGLDYNVGTVDNGITWCMITDLTEAETGSFSIYPNPATDVLNIDDLLPTDHVEMRDVLGKQVRIIQMNKTIQCRHLPAGMYLISIQRNGTTYSQRMVVER